MSWAQWRPQILESLETKRYTVKIIYQLKEMIKYSCLAFLLNNNYDYSLQYSCLAFLVNNNYDCNL